MARNITQCTEKNFDLFKKYLAKEDKRTEKYQYFDFPFDFDFYYDGKFLNTDCNVYLCLKDNLVKGFSVVYSGKENELHFIKDAFFTGIFYVDFKEHDVWKKTMVEYLIKEFQNKILIFHWDEDLDNIHPAIAKVNYNGKFGKYHYSEYLQPQYICGADGDYIRNEYEKVVSMVKQGNINYSKKSHEELSCLVRDKVEWKLPIVEDAGHNISFLGFRYFCPFELYNSKRDYIVAMIEDEVVGVLKIGEYGSGLRYTSVPYINVSTKYRRRGIAKGMIRELNKHLPSNKPLLLTELSEEGREARIDLVFKDEITSTKVYARSEEEIMYSQ